MAVLYQRELIFNVIRSEQSEFRESFKKQQELQVKLGEDRKNAEV